MIAKKWQNIDGTPMRNFYSQDGEAEILIPAMREEVQAAFNDANTDFVKGPPSATAKHQANDVNAAFRDTKAGVATVTRNDINTSNPTIAGNVKAAIVELKIAFPTAIITSPNVAKIVAAVETLTYVQKNGYVTATKHVESYKVRSIIGRIVVYTIQRSLYLIYFLT